MNAISSREKETCRDTRSDTARFRAGPCAHQHLVGLCADGTRGDRRAHARGHPAYPRAAITSAKCLYGKKAIPAPDNPRMRFSSNDDEKAVIAKLKAWALEGVGITGWPIA